MSTEPPAKRPKKGDEGIQSWLVPAAVPKLFKPNIGPDDVLQWGDSPSSAVRIQSMQYDDERQSFTVEWDVPDEGPLVEMKNTGNVPAMAATERNPKTSVYDGDIFCSHGLIMSQHIVKKEGPNTGRSFVSCPLSRFDMCREAGTAWIEDPCGAFYFTDDPAFADWLGEQKKGRCEPVCPAVLSHQHLIPIEAMEQPVFGPETSSVAEFVNELMEIDTDVRKYLEAVTGASNYDEFLRVFARRICAIPCDDDVRARLWHGEQRTDTWHQARHIRLSASSVGQLLGCSRFVTPANFMRQLLWRPAQCKGAFRPPPLLYGTKYEWVAERFYNKLLSGSDRGGEVRECGMWIDRVRPWLSASPDGLVMTGSKGPPSLSLLEIKQPYSKRDRPLGGAFYPVNRITKLPCPPEYLHQMVIQQLTCGLNHVDFCVFTPSGMQVTRVPRNEEMVRSTEARLRRLYINLIAPAVFLQTHGLLDAGHLQIRPSSKTGDVDLDGGVLHLLNMATAYDAP
jgi:hypothetical protein